MKKQWTAFLALVTLTASLTGCNQKENIVASETTDNTITAEEVTETQETNNEETEDTTEEIETEDTDEDEDETSDDAVSNEEEKNEETKKEETTSSNTTTNNKPNKNETTTTKPSTNTTKPSTNTSTSMKPNSSQSNQSQSGTSENKPATPPSSNTTVKPEKPVQKPEVTPETTPEVKPEETPALSCSQIFDQITSGIEFKSHMAADATLLQDFYGIDPSLLEDFCVKMPQLSFQITEIGVFKVKDANNVDSVVAGINNRVNNIGMCLYPSLQETFDKHVVKVQGNYILLAIADESASIASSFTSLVK